MLLILGVPMFWHKAALSQTVDWIGWPISLLSWTVSVPPENIQKIVEQLGALKQSKKPQIRDFQSLIGRLFWLTSAWHYLHPLLIPLYKALHRIPATMVGMDHVTFQVFIAALNPQLQLIQDLSHQHQSLLPGVTLVGIANTHVTTLDKVLSRHIKSSLDAAG